MSTTATIRHNDILNAITEEIRQISTSSQAAEHYAAADRNLAALLELAEDRDGRRAFWRSLSSIERGQVAWAHIRRREGLAWSAEPDTRKIQTTLEALDARLDPAPLQEATLEALEEAATLGTDRQRQAAKTARRHFAAGWRPLASSAGWIVESASAEDQAYTVIRGRCSCQAGSVHKIPCWHGALASALERAIDTLDQTDSDPEPPTYAPLGQRLAAARRLQEAL